LADATPLHSLQLRRKGGFPGPDEVEGKNVEAQAYRLLMTIVYWVFSLVLIYSVMMSLFRYAFGVQLPNPFSIFQGP